MAAKFWADEHPHLLADLDERERQNARKYRETPGSRCGWCKRKRAACICCERPECHAQCLPGSYYCRKHQGRVEMDTTAQFLRSVEEMPTMSREDLDNTPFGRMLARATQPGQPLCEDCPEGDQRVALHEIGERHLCAVHKALRSELAVIPPMQVLTRPDACQLCTNPAADTPIQYHGCCNGWLCVACHEYTHGLHEHAELAADTMIVGPMAEAEAAYVATLNAPVLPTEIVPAITLPCEVCEDHDAVQVATHHVCDDHFIPPTLDPAPQAPQQAPLPLGEPVVAYIVIGGERTPNGEGFAPRYHGLFVTASEAETYVRNEYIKHEHGIESLQDAAVRPEHYGMTVEEVQALGGEADEFVFGCYEAHTWYGDEQDRCIQICEQEIV